MIADSFFRNPADIGQTSAPFGIFNLTLAVPGPGFSLDSFNNCRSSVMIKNIFSDIRFAILKTVAHKFFHKIIPLYK